MSQCYKMCLKNSHKYIVEKPMCKFTQKSFVPMYKAGSESKKTPNSTSNQVKNEVVGFWSFKP